MLFWTALSVLSLGSGFSAGGAGFYGFGAFWALLGRFWAHLCSKLRFEAFVFDLLSILDGFGRILGRILPQSFAFSAKIVNF